MPAPTIKHCIVCEDVRFERRSIVTLVGTFGVTPDVAFWLADFAAPVARICFAFYGSAVQGTFDIRPEIWGPNGKLPALSRPPRLSLSLDPNKGASFFTFWFDGAKFPSPGQYSIVVFIDGVESFKSTFRVTPKPDSAQ
jgi:hypothetical protein